MCLQLPIVEDELKRAAGEKTTDEELGAAGHVTVQKLVTSDGTYATQSAFNTARYGIYVFCTCIFSRNSIKLKS